MNLERMKILRDHIAALPEEQFDMSDWKREEECGTVACIAGWACILFSTPEETENSGTAETAETVLDIDCDTSDSLFVGGFSTNHLWDITRDEAVEEMDRLILEEEARRREDVK